MKSKHLILCLIGFIVIVHAHYFNSWINYYNAPNSNYLLGKGLSKKSIEVKGSKDYSQKESNTGIDTMIVYQVDSTVINRDEFVDNELDYHE